ncbi:ArsI/CadI family heavy metal resistance metalloenzyme [Pseudoxanthomonas sp. 10H]|uniref:ArsI/CadI family heavy metal resistance metalloenzyme n=1 Tax=Pseudoxanthomonas sp. 10H TaxID=3242729 RepID=UPI003556121C
MNRFHVHLNVTDLDASLRFYTALFAAPPSVLKPDYAKWLLDDPRVNFAISHTGQAAGREPGIAHLGIQAGDADALADLGRRLDAAGGSVLPEQAATCCYARSDKFWTEDPQGTRWETFHTFGDATTYHAGGDASCATGGTDCAPQAPVAGHAVAAPAKAAGCCTPASGCC